MNPFMHSYQKNHGAQSTNAQRTRSKGRYALERNEQGELTEDYPLYFEYSQKSPRGYHVKSGPLRDKEAVLLKSLSTQSDEGLSEVPLRAKCLPKTPTIQIGEIKRQKPIDVVTALRLKQLLIGKSKKLPANLLGQGFTFRKNGLTYGLLQDKAGCCGVLAPVQAFIIKSLLCDSTISKDQIEPLRPNQTQNERALISALSEMLWQTGRSEARLVTTASNDSTSIDSVLDQVTVQVFTNKEDLTLAVERSTSYFTDPKSNGLFMFILSLILTRGVDKILTDMDDIGPLIKTNGYSSLELVNLVLTGSASRNFQSRAQNFNIQQRAEVGFLSIHEHYNSLQVGANLKTPKTPVWVINCDNHYTVLFSCQKELVSDWKVERLFQLYHYDTMQLGSLETKLRIDTTGLSLVNTFNEKTAPLLEHCIRTKWKDAVIKWSDALDGF